MRLLLALAAILTLAACASTCPRQQPSHGELQRSHQNAAAAAGASHQDADKVYEQAK